MYSHYPAVNSNPRGKTSEKATTTSFKSFKIHYSLTTLQFNVI